MNSRDWLDHLDKFERARVQSYDTEIAGLDTMIRRLRDDRRRLAKERELYVNRGSARAKLYERTQRRVRPMRREVEAT